MKLVLLVIGAIVVWLMITQPDTSAPIVAAVLRNTGTFLQEVLTALVKLISAVSGTIKEGST